MSDKTKPEVPIDELEEKVKQNPKSKRWNNPNSRKNLRQYRSESDPLIPEIILEGDDADDSDVQAAEITRGRKLNTEFVKKLIPKRGVFTSTEKQRYVGIVTTFLSDFKNEEPTASDIDDILEIAKCDIMEMRLLEASRDDPATLVAVSQSLERLYKRKQSAKENLAARRTDRKDARNYQEVSIVDLVVRMDNNQRQRNKERMDKLLLEEESAQQRLGEVLEKDGY